MTGRGFADVSWTRDCSQSVPSHAHTAVIEKNQWESPRAEAEVRGQAEAAYSGTMACISWPYGRLLAWPAHGFVYSTVNTAMQTSTRIPALAWPNKQKGAEWRRQARQQAGVNSCLQSACAEFSHIVAHFCAHCRAPVSTLPPSPSPPPSLDGFSCGFDILKFFLNASKLLHGRAAREFKSAAASAAHSASFPLNVSLLMNNCRHN